jgi:hypothetical protein
MHHTPHTVHSDAVCVDSLVDQITSNDYLGKCLTGRQTQSQGQSQVQNQSQSQRAPAALYPLRGPLEPRLQYMASDSPQVKHILAELIANGAVGGGAVGGGAAGAAAGSGDVGVGVGDGVGVGGARDVVEYLETDTIHIRLIYEVNSCVKLLKYGESVRVSSSQFEPVRDTEACQIL